MFYQLAAITLVFGMALLFIPQKGHGTLLAVVTVVEIYIETAFHISNAFYIPHVNTVTPRHICLQD